MSSTSHNGGEKSQTPGVKGAELEENGIANHLLRKLLLVDDEVDGAEFAAALLNANGLEVVVVHTAADALLALQNDK